MTHPHHLLSGLALSLAIASTGANAAGLTSEHKPFGKTRDGTPVEQYQPVSYTHLTLPTTPYV